MVGLCVSLALLSVVPGCRSEEPDAVTVEGARISVFNRTDDAWSDVRIRLNGYYVVAVPALAAGGRFDAPLQRFQGGFGRYFDTNRERVRSVEVTAAVAGGHPVTVTWRDGRIEPTSDTSR